MEIFRESIIDDYKKQMQKSANFNNWQTKEYDKIKTKNLGKKDSVCIETVENTIREYIHSKLNYSLLNNFKTCGTQIKNDFTDTSISDIAHKVESDILRCSETAFEYKCMTIQKTLEFEKCTAKNVLYKVFTNEDNDEDKKSLKQIDIREKKVDLSIASGQASPNTSKQLLHETIKENKVDLPIASGQASSNASKQILCETAKSQQCTRKIIDLMLSPFDTKALSENNLNNNSSLTNSVLSTPEKINITVNKSLIKDCSNGVKHIDQDRIDRNNRKLNDVNKKNQQNINYCIENVANKITYKSPTVKKIETVKHQLSVNDSLVKNTESRGINRSLFNILKPIIKKYYMSPFIPDRDSYKHVFRSIFSELWSKGIHDEDDIKTYAAALIKSKKYLHQL